MFGPRIDLFRVFGIRISIDLSWFILAFLITWSLARGLFPTWYPDLPTATYWWMGAGGALGLFASILLHELGHALTAERFGVPMRGITLFIFGGVAEMTQEPPSAKAEFFVAIAGPIVSVVLAVLLFMAVLIPMPMPVAGVLGWLGTINFILVLFNMIPAFPLDGGRVLRSALWQWKNNLRWATRVTASIGSGFGIMLMLLGVLVIFTTGALIAGIWWIVIGMFLRNAAQMSYQQLLIRRAIEGEPVSRFMRTEPVTVPPSLPLDRLVEDYVYRYHHKMYPVQDHGRLLGCVTTRNLQDVPRESWSSRTVGDVFRACGEENTISPDADATTALSRMSQTGASRMMVVDHHGQLVGIVSLKDLLGFISLKVELEESSIGSAPHNTHPPSIRRTPEPEPQHN